MAKFKDYLLKGIELKESAQVDYNGLSEEEAKAIELFPSILDNLSALSQETYDRIKDTLSFSDIKRFKGTVGPITQLKKGQEDRIPMNLRSLFHVSPTFFTGMARASQLGKGEFRV